MLDLHVSMPQDFYFNAYDALASPNLTAAAGL